MRRKWKIACAALALALAASADRPLHAGGDEVRERVARAHELTTTMDLDLATRELEAVDPEDPSVAVARGRLAIFSGDCDLASALLGRKDIAADEDVRSLADIARGCARVTAATVLESDPARGLEVRFQDENDRALFPLLAETVVRAREMLTRELGVDWPKPTRVVVVADHASLSAMTGLPYEDARKTGTVAVAKWGKVTLLSPRAAFHGYSWRDTVTHEMTHLAITRASGDRAPLWLQEGLAKRQEVRWRPPGPFDDRPTPESLVQRGMERKLDIPLDKLGPSIAMLGSADAALVAFAEVTSFVRYFGEQSSPDAIPKLLLALRKGKSVDDSLREVSGRDLRGWDLEWRAMIARRPKEPLSSLYGLGPPPKGMKDNRERVRLAELLLYRDHPRASLLEARQVGAELSADPGFRYVKGRALEATEKEPEARALVAEPRDVTMAYAPWWALRGRLARAPGDVPADLAMAELSFAEALAHDPFDPEAACESLTPPSTPNSLCAAALAKGTENTVH